MTSLTTYADYDEHIRPAIAMLDHLKPGWAFLLDLDKLNMMSGEDCILGQLYGSWHLGLSETQAYRSTLPTPEERASAYTSFADHTGGPFDRAWRREIDRRRAAA